MHDERNRLEDARIAAELRLLSREDMAAGKVPTTPTTASIIAGIQCQEAVKLIHGLETLTGRGFVFEGMSHESHVVAYTRKEDCPSHDPDDDPEVLAWRVAETRVGDFVDARARRSRAGGGGRNERRSARLVALSEVR